MTDPLVPKEVDLRDFSFMPLDVLRLRDSELSATPDAEAFRCAVLSWCVSWHQLPPASLPDDDATLSRLLGFGRDLEGWKRVRAADGLRGWVKCSDGRLYHPVVAEKAREAWAAKLAQRARTEAARKAREASRQKLSQCLSQGLSQGLSQTNGCSVTDKISVTDTVTDSKGQGQGQGQGFKTLEPLDPSGLVGQTPPDPIIKPSKGPSKANGKAKLSAVCKEILAFLNEKTGRNYQPVDANLTMIAARIREGATVIQMRQVIAKKTRDWASDEKMEQYLRPATLFNATKFAQYRGELGDQNENLP